MDKKILSAAGFFGMTGILLGAFGAHGLKTLLSEEALVTFETGVKYQMYHALFLLFVGLNSHLTSTMRTLLFRLIVFGIILFSGSIYLLATKSLTGLELKILGPITPVGGLCFAGAWGVLMFTYLKKKA
ncbi:DUF423 domain-containing protein [Flavobacterium sp.]|uniref:DUF423 domain-containing protein n=1 Tax=Flavobacterium sp. TaxID=239 RepID=UPI00260B1323|nr:DUF423 domain-containing protein [Flavobacterium sp.]